MDIDVEVFTSCVDKYLAEVITGITFFVVTPKISITIRALNVLVISTIRTIGKVRIIAMTESAISFTFVRTTWAIIALGFCTTTTAFSATIRTR